VRSPNNYVIRSCDLNVHVLLLDLPLFQMFRMHHMFPECNLPTCAIINKVVTNVANSFAWFSNFTKAIK